MHTKAYISMFICMLKVMLRLPYPEHRNKLQNLNHRIYNLLFAKIIGCTLLAALLRWKMTPHLECFLLCTYLSCPVHVFLVLLYQWSNHFVFLYVCLFDILFFNTALTAWFPNRCLYFLLFELSVYLIYYCSTKLFLGGFSLTFVPIFLAVIDHCFWTISLSFIFE